MKSMAVIIALFMAAVLFPAAVLAQTSSAAQTSAAASAKPPARPFQMGPVWTITFVHTKPGLSLYYMNYLATEWKREQEALKKAGLILDYKVIGTDAHNPNDWDLMLMTEFKDLATLEANEDKMEAVSMQALDLTDQKMIAGYEERSKWRDILGDRLAREIILEPKTK
jgi:hypothetical protein